MLKSACKKFGFKDNYKIAKLYNKNGIQLFQDDLVLLNHEDVCYIALKGKNYKTISMFKRCLVDKICIQI